MKAGEIHGEEDLCCPVCSDIFRYPVILSCGHSVCKECLETFWMKKETQECPFCRRRSSNPDPPLNLELKKQCESLIASKKMICNLHNEQLKFFCIEDKQLLCWMCQTSTKHKNHECGFMAEAADYFKKELKTTLKPLHEKLANYSHVKQTYHKSTSHIKSQTQQTEWQIKEEFEKLHQFLQDEEAVRIAALRHEEERNSQIMKKKIEEINSKTASLLETIRDIEENLKTEDNLFLQNRESLMERAQCYLKDPQLEPGRLIDVAKHLGNLRFNVWRKMQDIVQYSPVILDPNTAHPSLILSNDLTSMTFVGNYTDDKRKRINTDKDGENRSGRHDPQQLPDNPERFDECVCVLGSEGFDSGSHCWDIDFAHSYLWEVGITTESNTRKGSQFCSGVWSLESNLGFYIRSPAQPKSPFSAEGGLQGIRILLDYDRGQVSFYDLLNDTDILTFSHTFTEKVYPFFWSEIINSPIKILPMNLSVLIEQPE
ncbi:zinc-binding protein A33-like [Trichomycterus rosablanca]|uniref:zinc-binding protein A33-like n=1 Tax=Trichomycterus rosablanca TaxID=2290929 RepID=UPI002F360CCE